MANSYEFVSIEESMTAVSEGITYPCEEERDDLNDPQGKTSLKHRAIGAELRRSFISMRQPVSPERTQV